jgi:PITH domain
MEVSKMGTWFLAWLFLLTIFSLRLPSLLGTFCPVFKLRINPMVLASRFAASHLFLWHNQVRSIKFTEFNNGMDPESNPSKIHLFVNRENLGFEDCEDVDPTQTLHLTTEDLKESAEPILLKYVKYQRVKSLTLFIEDNQGGDITALGGLKLYGRPVVSTNMADFKKQQHE